MTSLRSRAAQLALALAVAVTPLSSVRTAAAAPPAALLEQVTSTGLPAVEASLDLLLRHYAQPLDASTLLQAAWQGALEAGRDNLIAEVLARPWPAERQGAWLEFQDRFALLAASGAEPDALARAANRAMARSLDDCHTRLAPSYDRELEMLSGNEKYGGIGASALEPSRFEPPAPGPVVVHLVAGAPAASAGLRLGDAVLAVDGVSTAGMPNSRMVELIRGLPGSVVQLLVDRPGAPEPVVVPIVRGLVELPLLEHRLLPAAAAGGAAVGYLQLRSFAPPVEPLLPRALDELYAQGARAFVLDLRHNGGGDVRTFSKVASLFIKEGPLAVATDRHGSEAILSASGVEYKPFAAPVAVLVNALSASASELLAADLQEHAAARIFGETTAGCFGYSQIFRVSDGSAMWITVRKLQSGLGRRDVHKVGVTPDEPIGRTRSDLASGHDPQLATALAWLGSAAAPTGVAA